MEGEVGMKVGVVVSAGPSVQLPIVQMGIRENRSAFIRSGVQVLTCAVNSAILVGGIVDRWDAWCALDYAALQWCLDAVDGDVTRIPLNPLEGAVGGTNGSGGECGTLITGSGLRSFALAGTREKFRWLRRWALEGNLQLYDQTGVSWQDGTSVLVAILYMLAQGCDLIELFGADWSGSSDCSGTERARRDSARWQLEKIRFEFLQKHFAKQGVILSRYSNQT